MMDFFRMNIETLSDVSYNRLNQNQFKTFKSKIKLKYLKSEFSENFDFFLSFQQKTLRKSM